MSRPRWKFTPRNVGQEQLVDALTHNDLIFAIGPAGTGKTHAAICLAKQYTDAKQTSTIVVARPTVGAGENNGYLPGTLQEKLGPYMAPVYEIFSKICGPDSGLPGYVHLCSFEHMRGTTFEDSFIVIDEAQNATFSQLELALTRMGKGSKMIIAGDPSQDDLRGGSGLNDMVTIASSIAGVDVVHFLDSYCMRHDLVAQLSRAIAKHKVNKCQKSNVNTNTQASAEMALSSALIVKPGLDLTDSL